MYTLSPTDLANFSPLAVARTRDCSARAGRTAENIFAARLTFPFAATGIFTKGAERIRDSNESRVSQTINLSLALLFPVYQNTYRIVCADSGACLAPVDAPLRHPG